MPYTTVYVDDGKGVHKTGTGVVTGLDIFTSAMRDGLDEARAPAVRYGLVDYSEVTEMKVTPDDIRRLVEMHRKFAELTPGRLVAIVAPSPLPYALARLWHTLADDLPWKTNVFHHRADAIAWLRYELIGQDGPETTPLDFPSLSI